MFRAENHPTEMEISFSKPPIWGSMLIFQGVPLDPKTIKNEGFTPQNMGEITPKNEGFGFPW